MIPYENLALNVPTQFFLVTSSTNFRRELPTSKVAGEISMGLNSFRSEGTLSFMLSHLTLRMQARMKQYAIRPLSLLSASGHMDIPGEIICYDRTSFKNNISFILEFYDYSSNKMRLTQ
ncbi:MAG: hypothetical protein ACYDAO_03415 [Thermoplasmataceae archaeon]